MNEVLIGAYYNHYKNKLYKVLNVAKHSEDLTDYVVYQALYQNETAQTWVRPYSMFIEQVQGVPRFALMDPQHWPVQFFQFQGHIYFTEKNYDRALAFQVEFKRSHPQLSISELIHLPTGPHPYGMFQVSFNSEIFLELISFMQKNRNGLSVLVHPVSGNQLMDYTEHAMFLGKKVELNIAGLNR